MNEVIELLKEQNKLTMANNKMISDSIQEFLKLQKLLAAESRLGNARSDIMDETLQKLLIEITTIGESSKHLLKEMTR